MVVALVVLFFVKTTMGHQTRVVIGDTAVLARVADTESTRIRGLSGTHSLNEDQAMLFVFDRASDWSIWMKDMRYPIDVIWIDETKTVVDFTSNLTPASYPHSFKPGRPALYVLEVPSGFASRHSVRLGTRADFLVPR